MLAYLLAGALHGVCDLDVAHPSGGSVVGNIVVANTVTIMSAPKGADGSEKAVIAEHHCHACFSVSVPAPVLAATLMEPAAGAPAQPTVRDSGLVPGIEPPPPKA